MWESFVICGLVGDESILLGFLINGYLFGRSFSGICDISNIEYVEVMKGFGFVFYGCFELGGIINIIIKKL